MRRLVLASHGSLAEGFKSAANMILGNDNNIQAYGLDQWVTPKSILDEVRKEIKKSPETEFIILCDLKGGSVHSCMMELLEHTGISIFTGMNLTLVLELAVLGEEDVILGEHDKVMEISRDNIRFFNKQMLEQIKEEEGEDKLW